MYPREWGWSQSDPTPFEYRWGNVTSEEVVSGRSRLRRGQSGLARRFSNIKKNGLLFSICLWAICPDTGSTHPRCLGVTTQEYVAVGSCQRKYDIVAVWTTFCLTSRYGVCCMTWVDGRGCCLTVLAGSTAGEDDRAKSVCRRQTVCDPPISGGHRKQKQDG